MKHRTDNSDRKKQSIGYRIWSVFLSIVLLIGLAPSTSALADSLPASASANTSSTVKAYQQRLLQALDVPAQQAKVVRTSEDGAVTPLIKITTVAENHEVSPGEAATFTMTVENLGSDDLKDVAVTDPEVVGSNGVTLTGAFSGTWDATGAPSATTITKTSDTRLDINSLKMGERIIFSYSVVIPSDTPSGTQFSYTVNTTGVGVTSVETANDADDDWTKALLPSAPPPPAIRVEKVVDNHDKLPGERATFIIMATNFGQAEIKDVVLDDEMVCGTSSGQFLNDTLDITEASEISLNTTNTTATHLALDGTFRPGESFTINYEITLPGIDGLDPQGANETNAEYQARYEAFMKTDAGLASSFDAQRYDNMVFIGGTGVLSGQTATDDDSDWVRTPEKNPVIPMIKITKAADRQVVLPGETANFTVTVENIGSDDLKDVVVTDPEVTGSDGATLSGAFSGTWDAAGAPSATTITKTSDTQIDINSLKAGEYITFTYGVAIPPETLPDVTFNNTANTSGVGVVSDKTVTDADDAFVKTPNLIGPPSIDVQKTVDAHLHEAGETVTFIITTTNSGMSDLDNVALDDTMVYGDTAGQFDGAMFSYAGTGGLAYDSANSTTTHMATTGMLKAGESFTITYTFDIPENTPGDSIFENTVFASGIDVHTHENVVDSDDDWTKVPLPPGVPPSRIKVQKVVDNHDKLPGERATFTIMATIDGHAAIQDVVLDDEMVCGTSAGRFLNDTLDTTEASDISLNATDTTATHLALDGTFRPGESFTINYEITLPGIDGLDPQGANETNAEYQARYEAFMKTDAGLASEFAAQRYDNKVFIGGTGVRSGLTATDDDSDWVRTPEKNPIVPDIKITKTADMRIILPGDIATFTVIVENLGSEDLKDVVVTDPTVNGSDGATLSGAFSDTWDATGAPSAPIITKTSDTQIAINSLKSGEFIIFSYSVAIPDDIFTGGTFSNTANTSGVGVVSDKTVTDADDDYVKALLPPAPPSSIDVQKTVDVHEHYAGETATFTITTTNSGKSDLDNVTLDDTMIYGNTAGQFDGAMFSYAGTGGLAYDSANSTTTHVATTGTLKAGESFTITYTFDIPENAAWDSLYENIVTASGTGVGTDENVTDSDEDWTKTIWEPAPPSSIRVKKVVDNHDKLPGERTTFTIVATNDGHAEIKDVTLDDAMVYGASEGKFLNDTLDTTEGSDMSLNATDTTATHLVLDGTFHPGDTFTIDYEITLPGIDGLDPQGANETNAEYQARYEAFMKTDAGLASEFAARQYDNKVFIGGTGVLSGQTATDDDSDWVRTPEKNPIVPDIKITKTADMRIILAGETATFKMTVENLGSEDLKDVVVTDPEVVGSNGVMLSGAFSNTWDATGAPSAPTITKTSDTQIDINSLKVGEYITFTYSVAIPSDIFTGGTFNNTANTSGVGVVSGKTVTDADDDYVETNNWGGNPTIDVKKTIEQHEYLSGEEAIFTITTTNTGTEDLKNVTLDDVMIYGTQEGYFNAESFAYTGAGGLTYDSANSTTAHVATTGTLKVGESFTITYTFDIPGDAWFNSRFENTVFTGGTGVDSNEDAIDRDEEYIRVFWDGDSTIPSIRVSEVVDSHDKLPGERATFTIAATNNGIEALKDFVLDDRMLYGTFAGRFLNDTLYTTEGSDISLNTTDTTATHLALDGTFHPGESFKINYEITLPGIDGLDPQGANETNAEYQARYEAFMKTDAGLASKFAAQRYDNKVTIGGTGVNSGKTVIDDDSDWVRTPEKNPIVPEIKITKVADEQTVFPGDTATFTVIVENLGSEDLKDVVVTDPTVNGSDGATLSGAFSDTWDATGAPSAPIITKTSDTQIDINSLKSGEFIIFSYSVAIPSETLPDIAFNNTVNTSGVGVVSDKTVTDADDDFVKTPDVIGGLPSIDVQKTVDAHVHYPGDTVFFKIVTTNSGMNDLDNVTLDDTMVYGDTAGQFEAASFSYAGTGGLAYDSANSTTTHVATTGTLKAGESFTITYTFDIPENAAWDSLYENIVTASGTGVGTDENVVDSDDDWTKVPFLGGLPPSIDVRKVVDTHDKYPGQRAIFTITATNNGGEALKNVMLDDVMVYGDYSGTFVAGTQDTTGAPNLTITDEQVKPTQVTSSGFFYPGESFTIEYVFTVPTVEGAPVQEDTETDAAFEARYKKWAANEGMAGNFPMQRYDNKVSITGTGITSNLNVSEVDSDWIRTPVKDRVATYQPVVTIQVIGETPSTDDSFTFTLEGLDGAPMPATAVDNMVKATVQGSGDATFDKIVYDTVGTYAYRLMEENGGIADYTYDETEYTLTVAVENQDDGLVATGTFASADTGTTDMVTFANTYNSPASNPLTPDPSTPTPSTPTPPATTTPVATTPATTTPATTPLATTPSTIMGLPMTGDYMLFGGIGLVAAIVVSAFTIRMARRKLQGNQN